MGDCNHEEADTRMVVHVMDSLEKGFNDIMIRTVDTDVIVILIGDFYTIHESYPSSLWSLTSSISSCGSQCHRMQNLLQLGIYRILNKSDINHSLLNHGLLLYQV